MRILLFIAALTGASVHAQTCASEEGLKAIVANYFKAVEAHNPSALATTTKVRITENAVEIKPGEGFFKTGGKAQLRRTIIDTGTCSTLTQAVPRRGAGGKTGPILTAAVPAEIGGGQRE